MIRSFVAAKLHNVHVTDKSVEYHGSVGIGADLLASVGIAEFERVDIINLANGARWSTYAIAIDDGCFSLNGGGARLGELGDRCVILTYALAEQYTPARVSYCQNEDGRNVVVESFEYAAP